MVGSKGVRTAFSALLALALWALYFVLCGAAARAPFIYADF
jgi:hypothetical protein